MDESAIALRVDFENRIQDVLNIIELNEQVIRFANSQLSNVKKELLSIGRGAGVSQKIDNISKSLTSLRTNPKIITQKQIVREQVLVLFIGTLQSYLSDVIRLVGNERPDLFSFHDENEKITFSQSMLKDGFKLGDAILEHVLSKKYSFQDLKSSLDALKIYLNVEVDLSKYHKDILILTAAARHVVVHNSSRVDRRFMDSIRATSYSSKFRVGQSLQITDDMVKAAKEAMLNYADQITAALLSKS